MGSHEITPSPIPIDFTELIDKEGPFIEQVKLVNAVVVLANAALREYGLEILPTIESKKD